MGVILWDETYNKDNFHYGLKPNDFLAETINEWKHCKSALCIGAGEGRNAIYLLENGLEVSALDQSKVGLEKFTKQAKKRSLVKFKTICSKLEEHNFDGKKLDLITAIWFHGDASFKAQLYRIVREQLSPGGLFLMEAYRPEQLEFGTGGPPKAELMYTKQEVEASLAGFEILILKEENRIVEEGVGHSGQSAVLQVLAKIK